MQTKNVQHQPPLVRDGIPVLENRSRNRLLLYWLLPPLLYCLICIASITSGFLLFHFLIELGAIVIGIMSLAVASIANRYHQSSLHLVAASGLGWSAIIDTFHVATYYGSGLLAVDDPNLATQLWIAARLLQAGSLLIALLLMKKQLNFLCVNIVMAVYCLLIGAFIVFGQFPDAYLTERGLTTFKINAEYLIVFLFLVSAALLYARHAQLPVDTYLGIMAAIVSMTLSEILFTQYANVYDLINGIGHIAKFAAYWFLFQALVYATIESPFKSLHELNFLLRERVKELQGLSDISTIRGISNLDINQIMNDVIAQLPQSFLYPDMLLVGIESKWGQFGDSSAIASDRRIERPIILNDENVGTLTVGYAADAPIAGDIFLVEEYRLVELVRTHLQNVLDIIIDRQQISHISNLYRMLSDTNRAVAQSDTLDSLMENLFRTLSKGDTFPVVLAIQVHNDKSRLTLEYSKGVNSNESREKKLLGEFKSLITQFWPPQNLTRENLFHVLTPIPENSAILALSEDESIEALGLLPICNNDKLFAFFGIAVRKYDELGGDYSALLEQMARDFRFAARSFSEQQLRRKAEQRAETREQQFEAVFQYSPLPLVILDSRGEQIRFVNRSYVRWLGTGVESITSVDNWIETFLANNADYSDAIEHWRSAVAIVGESERVHTLPHVELRSLTGEIKIGEARVTRFDHEILVAWTDLTEIRASEQRFNSMIEQAAMPVWVHDNERFLYGNPAFCNLIGQDQNELPGKKLNIFISVPNMSEQQSHAESSSASGPINAVLAKLKTNEEDSVDFSVQTSSIQWSGSAAFISVGENVKERLATERELRNSYNLLSNLSKQVPGVIYQFQLFPDGRSCFPFASERMDEIYELSPDEVREDASRVYDRLHPDDRKAVEASIAESAEQLTDWIADYRVNLPVQGLRWRSGFAHPVKMDDGSVLWHGFIQDSTERKHIDEELKRRNIELQNSMRGTLELVARMVEMRDPYTAGHEERVARIVKAIATELNLPKDRIELLEWAGMVHDVGKISIPSEILSKPTRLTKTEFEIIKDHARAGYDIVKGSPLPDIIAQTIWQHHERLDGSGYPRGLKGEEILFEAKILAVADVLESMSSHRPYRPALGVDTALEELSQHKGVLYDSSIVDAVTGLIESKRLTLGS